MSTSSSSSRNVPPVNNSNNFNRNTLIPNGKNKLVNDLTNLLNKADCYDTEIKIGKNQNVETFKVHAAILKARSSYFKAALSANWARRTENGIISFEKENISPKIFKILLE